MTRPYLSEAPARRELNRQKAKLVVRLRDEQRLTWTQIAVQIARGPSWCSKTYFASKKERKERNEHNI